MNISEQICDFPFLLTPYICIIYHVGRWGVRASLILPLKSFLALANLGGGKIGSAAHQGL